MFIIIIVEIILVYLSRSMISLALFIEHNDDGRVKLFCYSIRNFKTVKTNDFVSSDLYPHYCILVNAVVKLPPYNYNLVKIPEGFRIFINDIL